MRDKRRSCRWCRLAACLGLHVVCNAASCCGQWHKLAAGSSRYNGQPLPPPPLLPLQAATTHEECATSIQRTIKRGKDVRCVQTTPDLRPLCHLHDTSRGAWQSPCVMAAMHCGLWLAAMVGRGKHVHNGPMLRFALLITYCQAASARQQITVAVMCASLRHSEF